MFCSDDDCLTSYSEKSADANPEGLGGVGEEGADVLSQNMSQLSMNDEERAEQRKKRVYVWVSGMGQQECK